MIQKTSAASPGLSDIRGGEVDVDKVYPSGVRVGRTSYGLGLFAFAFIPAGTPIARVFGRVIHDPDYHSDYCIDVGEDRVLEPAAPFCYMNHSCEPNCILMHYVAEEELDGTEIEGNLESLDEDEYDEEDEDECVFSEDFDEGDFSEANEDEDDDAEVEYPGDEIPPTAEVWVETLRDLFPGDELTIDYAWPADRAAKCLCGSPNCRGWICDPEELDQLTIDSGQLAIDNAERG
ncbi:MAG TPA: hypothetical protein DEB39_12495 [Planctomycetaceae bacterium]|nr:hypothetical protein [Planctomycetaceae bacterium]